jgi:hypothetical protein
MTQDEIIEMAEQAEFCISPIDSVLLPKLEAFAKLVAVKEREACANLCETDGRWWAERKCLMESGEAAHLASAIRARGQA